MSEPQQRTGLNPGLANLSPEQQEAIFAAHQLHELMSSLCSNDIMSMSFSEDDEKHAAAMGNALNRLNKALQTLGF